jgi:hypothetical protein
MELQAFLSAVFCSDLPKILLTLEEAVKAFEHNVATAIPPTAPARPMARMRRLAKRGNGCDASDCKQAPSYQLHVIITQKMTRS